MGSLLVASGRLGFERSGSISMWELFLALAFLMTPVGFLFSTCGCVCNVTFCTGKCSNNPPAKTVTMSLSGVANGTCSLCTEANGTWVNNWTSTACFSNLITENFSTTDPNCGAGPAAGQWNHNHDLTASGGDTFVRTLISGGPNSTWTYDGGASPITCPPTGVLTMTFISKSGVTCDYTSAALTVQFT